MEKRRFGGIALVGLSLFLVAGAPPGQSPGDAASIGRNHAHYEAVLEELRAADQSALSTSQKKLREEAIDRLAAYCAREQYPVNTEDPLSRLPYFRDAEGRHCAVATLLHEMGGQALVDRVASTDNHAFISELSDVPEFKEWLDRVGLTLSEAVRIGAPAVHSGETISTATPAASTTGSSTQTPTDTGLTPVPTRPTQPIPPVTPGGDGTPFGPSTGGGDLPGPATGGGRLPSTGGSGGVGPRGPVTGRGGGRTPAGAGSSRETASSLGADSWSLWWEFNKTAFLDRNVLKLVDGPGATTGGGADATVLANLHAARQSVVPLLRAALKADDGRVRASAATALARVAGERAVPDLMPLLSDNFVEVRESALLALAATGSPAAKDTLVRIAETGGLDSGPVTGNARGLALIALGLGRAYGMPAADADVARIFDAHSADPDEQVELGAMFHYLLAPSGVVGNRFHPLHSDKSQPDSVRAHTLELLPHISNDGKKTLEALQYYLNGDKLELRRSAALALGAVHHELVLPRITTAYELETEPVTRGFTLLAIARQGGATARDFLVNELHKGKDKEMKPWAALALAEFARETPDATALAALRVAKFAKADRGARYLALGLARDVESLEEVARAAADERNLWNRAHAVTALALMGGDAAHDVLRTCAKEESDGFVRVFLALALSHFGDDADAPFLVDTLRNVSDPSLQAQAAVALGFHGSPVSFEMVRDAARDESLTGTGRAAVIDALGLMLDRRPGLAIPATYRNSNIGVLPVWAIAAFRSSL